MVCPCGNPKLHVVAKRDTMDGQRVALWSDGAISNSMGFALPGVPLSRPHTEQGIDAAVQAGWLFLDYVELFNVEEIPLLFAACRRVTARGLHHSQVWTLIGELSTPGLRPVWETTRLEQDGRPAERIWRLPRLRWPGLVVFDHCVGTSGRDSARVASGGAEGCRYEVMRLDGDTAYQIGARFATLKELSAYLLGCAEPEWA